MKVFISWSGERSKQLAQHLKNWLPKVIQSLDPWMSAEDIRAGGRWLLEVSKQLEEASFGVVCLTAENLSEPWILFEAGALGKELETAYVCPYLLGLEPSAISGPLAQFQAKRANRDDTLALLESINLAAGDNQRPLTDALLQEAFSKWWPDLEAGINGIPDRVGVPAQRRDRDMIEEILNLTRQIARRPSGLFLKTNKLPAFRQFIRARRAALAGFMQQGAQLRLRGDHLAVIPKSDIYTRYLTDNVPDLTDLASEFFKRPMTVTVGLEESERPEVDE